MGCGSSKSGSGGSGSGGAAGVDGGNDSGAGAAGSGGAAGNSGSGGTSGSAGSSGVPGPVCFLTNCASDAECADCSNGRTRCDVPTHRCVACDPSAGTGCSAGQTCTKYGTCAAAGQACATDAQGVPTVTCSSDADCASCDSMHQVCDTSTSRCVACSSTDASACQGNQHCDAAGACADNCPDPCSSDADCGQCGAASGPAHACNLAIKKCAQCSATLPCASGEVCAPQGVCVKVCGQLGKPKGTCQSDTDCAGCGADAIACHVPINGGDGKCGVPASGCSDIGKGVVALPQPWSSVTNLCSNDQDCSGVGLDLNVGKLLRDVTGLDFIHDATLQYGMNSCASISVGLPGVGTKSCGLCVPCKTDADCSPIQVDPLVDQAFSGVSSIAAKWALDKLFGDKPHQLDMYCEPVAGDYGVCAPCSDPTSVCGVASTQGSGCTNDWECAAGEYCNAGKCQAVGGDCSGGTQSCTGGNVCGWNGDGYCCRPPATGTKSCVADSECTPDLCTSDGNGGFVCGPKVANCK